MKRTLISALRFAAATLATTFVLGAAPAGAAASSGSGAAVKIHSARPLSG